MRNQAKTTLQNLTILVTELVTLALLKNAWGVVPIPHTVRLLGVAAG